MALRIRDRMVRGFARMLGVRAQVATPGSSFAHEGATVGRRMGLWGLSSYGPNAAILSSLRSIRSRSRELVRNDPWAKRGREALVKELVGTGINPIWRIPDNPSLARELQQLFRRWTDESDADGVADWQGQQTLIASELVEAGECLARDRPRRISDGLLVPYQVQVLEPDFLDESLTYPLENGNALRMGIEFDAVGRRRAYILSRSHPGDIVPMSAQGDGDRVRVPAEDIRHVFHVERAGQIRALPWFSSVILRLYELSQYDDAQLVRQKLAAMYTGHLFPDAGGGPSSWPGTTDGTTTPAGQTVMDWEPGLFQVVPQGFGKLEFSSPPDPGAHFDEFTKFHLRAFAAGLGPITFEQISNNLADVNFSSIRAGLQEVREMAEVVVWKTLIFQFCRPTAHRWLDAAVLSGAVSIPDYFDNPAPYRDITWIPPKKGYVDPLKDWAADILSVRAALRAPQDVILARGDDPEEVLEKIAEWNAKLAERGIISDANPAQTGQGGKIQSDAVLAAELARQAQ